MAKKIIIGGSTEVVVPEKSDISQQIKDEAQLESLVFDNQQELEEWIEDGLTEHQGYLPSDLKIGQNIYTLPDDEPDFWVVSTPVTSMSNLEIIGSEIEGVIPSLPYAEKEVPENDDEFYLYDGSTKKLKVETLLQTEAYRYIATDGLSDYTSEINDVCDRARTLNKKYIYFVKDMEYPVTSKLNKTYGLLFVGNGKLVSSSNDNMYIYINPLNKYFNEKINKGFDIENFIPLFNAIKNKSAKVVFVGDSMTTSADSISPFDRWYVEMEDALRTRFKDVTFTMYNRAIGGTSLNGFVSKPTPEQMASVSWYTDTNKNWLEYIEELTPDLVFVAFGMNGGEELNTHQDNMKIYIDEMESWTKKPTLVILTNLTNAYIDDVTTWGGITEQRSKIGASQISKYYGLYRNKYIIDTGRMFQLIRNGFDYENIVYQGSYNKDNFDVVGSGGTVIDNNTTIIGTDELRSRKQISNFEFSFDVNVPSTPTAHVRIRFRWFLDVRLTSSTLQFYVKNTNIGNSSISFGAGNHTVLFRVIKDIVEIYIDGTMVRRVNNVYFFGERQVILSMVSNTDNFVFSNIAIKNYTPQLYTPYATDIDIFGDYYNDDGDGGTINHVSSNGNSLVYTPCILDFINEIDKEFDNYDYEKPLPTNYITTKGLIDGTIVGVDYEFSSPSTIILDGVQNGNTTSIIKIPMNLEVGKTYILTSEYISGTSERTGNPYFGICHSEDGGSIIESVHVYTNRYTRDTLKFVALGNDVIRLRIESYSASVNYTTFDSYTFKIWVNEGEISRPYQPPYELLLDYKVDEAPKDGKTYGRKDGEWVEIV